MAHFLLAAFLSQVQGAYVTHAQERNKSATSERSPSRRIPREEGVELDLSVAKVSGDQAKVEATVLS